MATERTDPTRRRPIRWGAVLLSLPLTAVAGHIAIGKPRRALFLLVAEVILFALAAGAVLMVQPELLYVVLGLVVLIALGSLVDVGRMSRVGSAQLHTLPAVAAGVGTLVFTAGLAYLARTYVVQAYRTPAASMVPTLEVGDNFFVNKLTRNIRRGDVVVFKYPLDPSVEYVKRVVAVGGDFVTVDEGEFLINGQAPHAERQGVEQRMDPVMGQHTVERWTETLDGRSYTIYRRAGPLTPWDGKDVPQGHVFVLGDNRDASSDSRSWGTVPLELVEGRALFIWWSRDDKGVRWERMNKRVQ
jgi:signal peptidase I